MNQTMEASSIVQDRERLTLDPKTILELWSQGGEMNTDVVENWMKALRHWQTAEAKFQSWIGKVKLLIDLCQFIVDKDEWIQSIWLSFQQEPEQIYIYIGPTNYGDLGIQHHRQVAGLGLLMSNIMNVRVESRLSLEAPGAIQLSRRKQ